MNTFELFKKIRAEVEGDTPIEQGFACLDELTVSQAPMLVEILVAFFEALTAKKAPDTLLRDAIDEIHEILNSGEEDEDLLSTVEDRLKARYASRYED